MSHHHLQDRPARRRLGLYRRWRISEPFPSHAAALAAARRAAAEQRVPGRTEAIEYETSDGKWHTETAAGGDRPDTDVEDTAVADVASQPASVRLAAKAAPVNGGAPSGDALQNFRARRYRSPLC